MKSLTFNWDENFVCTPLLKYKLSDQIQKSFRYCNYLLLRMTMASDMQLEPVTKNIFGDYSYRA